MVNKLATHFPTNSKNKTFEYIIVDDLENYLNKEISILRSMQKRRDLTSEGMNSLGTLLSIKVAIGRLK